MATDGRSLFGWPASPKLTALHLIARTVLVMTNVVGLSVSYAAGSITNTVSFFVAGAFMTISLLIFQPIFMIWNKRQLRRSKMVALNEETVPQGLRSILDLSSSPPISTKFLEFAIVMDTIGVLGYWIVWGFTLHDSIIGGRRYYYWHSARGDTTLEAYASVATLTCALIHSFLLATQLLQVVNARHAKSLQKTFCPNCHHSLDDMTGDRSERPSHGPSANMPSAQPEESRNLLGRDSYEDDVRTVVDMTPGQETGTCTKTPRVSTSSNLISADNNVAAEEGGTSESDRLIEKIVYDLHATTQGGWFSRVMPHLG